jgi:hypothetical protein
MTKFAMLLALLNVLSVQAETAKVEKVEEVEVEKPTEAHDASGHDAPTAA